MDRSAQVSAFTSTCFSTLSPLEAAVGNTPLLPLQRLAAGINPDVQILAKAEWFNPGGSVKDRPALNIMRTALCNGTLGLDGIPFAGKRLLDSTSGNMGISYATFGVTLGIPVTLVLPENASPERIAILRALGAELILSDAGEGSDGAIRKVREIAANSGNRYWYANQYDNPANWQAHYLTTGPEIAEQTFHRVTHFVAGLGTTGTLTGVGRYLKSLDPSIQIIAVQPAGPFHGLEGLKHLPTALRPGIFDPALPDRTLPIETEAAYEMVRRLAREEGLFVGISSGAAAFAALQLAREIDSGIIVTVFPDAGYKYLSDHEIWKTQKP